MPSVRKACRPPTPSPRISYLSTGRRLIDWCAHDSSWPYVAGLLLLAEAVLCILIILRIPYTEIDWRAYMEEVGGFLDGERDYLRLKGETGPLV